VTYAIIILCFLAPFVIGFFSLRKDFLEVSSEHDMVEEFRNRYVSFANHFLQTGQPTSDYTWLVMNSDRVQQAIGIFGIIATFSAPFRMYTINNYQIIINTIPKFKDGSLHENEAEFVDTALMRYLGNTAHSIDTMAAEARNPFIWFRQGFQLLVGLPIYFLSWFGLLSAGRARRIVFSAFFKVLAGIGGIVAFLSGVVTLIQGKDQTITFIKQFFHH